MEYVIKLPDGFYGGEDHTRWHSAENAERFPGHANAKYEAYLLEGRLGLGPDQISTEPVRPVVSQQV